MARLLQTWTVLSVLLSILATHAFAAPSNLTIQAIPQVGDVEAQIQAVCQDAKDCNYHGVCINGTVCQCDPGWTARTDANGLEQGPCSYKQATKKSAFLFSLFLGGFGADWFYLSRKSTLYIIIGVVKLLVNLVTFILTPSVLRGKGSEKDKTKPFPLKFIIIFVNLLTITWWIVDWARILANKFPDGNGVPLLPW